MRGCIKGTHDSYHLHRFTRALILCITLNALVRMSHIGTLWGDVRQRQTKVVRQIGQSVSVAVRLTCYCVLDTQHCSPQ